MEQKRSRNLVILATLTGISAGIAISGGAYAAGGAENDALEAPATRIGLAQAVNAAEQQAAGKAVRAELERVKGQVRWAYDVEVVDGKKVMDVKVDPDSGKVLAATEDKVEHDDGQDKED